MPTPEKSRRKSPPEELDPIPAINVMPRRFPDDPPLIVIQRLTTVASVYADPHGDESVIDAAWKSAGGVLAGSVRSGESDAVQFVYDDVIHRASVELPGSPPNS